MNPRRVSRTIWGISVGAVVASIVLDLSTPNSEPDLGWYAFVAAGVLLYATVGALITSRQVGNRVGLLFAWIGLTASTGAMAGSYTSLAVERGLPLASFAAWFAQVAFAAMLGPLAFLFLIFPTGNPASRRWGWLGRVMLVAYAVTIVLFAVTPGPLEAGFAEQHAVVMNPFALPASWERGVEAATTVAASIVFLGAIVSVLSLFQRYKRAGNAERQQIRWLARLGGFIAAYFVLLFTLEFVGVLPEDGALPAAMFLVLLLLIFVGIPVLSAVAILKHGLWDLDVVIKKTVQYGVLVVGITTLLVVLGVAAPTLVIGAGGSTGSVLPFLVGVAFTILVLFARSRARRWANRLVYGTRASPYEVLSEFAERVGETYSTEDVLPRMAQLLGEASGARVARVWLRVDDEMRAVASWPAEAPMVPTVDVHLDRLPSFGGDTAFEVRHQGELLGALTITEAADDPMNTTKTKLAVDMASQAGLVLRNVRLIQDLRESRRRIVTAQDARAKKLERDIHDGAQQQLVALSVKLGLVERLIATDAAKAVAIVGDAKTETNAALEDLRDLARGIYPPLLADQGLAAALQAQARKAPVPVLVENGGIGRFSQEAEAAVYFSCLEALQNVAKYAEASEATIHLAQANGTLTFAVADDGRGFDPNAAERGTGLQGIADRLAALGGTMRIESAPGAGTTVTGTLPVGGIGVTG